MLDADQFRVLNGQIVDLVDNAVQALKIGLADLLVSKKERFEREEREAWDRYAAGAIRADGVFVSTYAKIADAMLQERRTRFTFSESLK